MPILYLTEAEVARVMTMDLALDAVASAFRKLALEEAVNVPRQRCQTDHVMLHVLPAAAKTLDAIGFKAYTTSRQGAQFHVTLFDPRHGGMTAIVEADLLGQFRTGAASGVATKKLARPDASTVGLFGTGKQARTQLLAVCKVRPIKKVHVYGRDAERRKAFAAQLSQETGVEVVPVENPEEAARGLDVVITATTSREPVLITGSPGGRTIINTVLCVVLNVTEFEMSIGEAVSAPRLHHQWFPDAAKFEGVKQHPELVKGLKALGHTVTEARQGDAHSIWIDPKTGQRVGAADRRLDGKAVGE